jgi:hypothetical protein
MDKTMCELCLNKGWIWTINTNTNTQEVQKCDDCNVFESDQEAQYNRGGDKTMKEFDLSIDELEALCEKYDLMLSDPLIGLISDVIVMVLNKEETRL